MVSQKEAMAVQNLAVIRNSATSPEGAVVIDPEDEWNFSRRYVPSVANTASFLFAPLGKERFSAASVLLNKSQYRDAILTERTALA